MLSPGLRASRLATLFFYAREMRCCTRGFFWCWVQRTTGGFLPPKELSNQTCEFIFEEQREMAENQEPGNNLKSLGAGVGSKVERIKIESAHLRGRIVEELAQESPRFSEDQIQLLKFHG